MIKQKVIIGDIADCHRYSAAEVYIEWWKADIWVIGGGETTGSREICVTVNSYSLCNVLPDTYLFTPFFIGDYVHNYRYMTINLYIPIRKI